MKNYGDDNRLYVEYMPIDKLKSVRTRSAYTIYDVLGDVGGFQQVLLMISVFIFSQYSDTSFRVEAINKLFQIKTEHMHLLDEKESLKTNFCTRIRLMFKCL